MHIQARSLSSSSKPGCRNCAISSRKTSHAEYFKLFGPFEISILSHAMAIRHAFETLLFLLLSPSCKLQNVVLPVSIILLAILQHHPSIPGSCRSYEFSIIHYFWLGLLVITRILNLKKVPVSIPLTS